MARNPSGLHGDGRGRACALLLGSQHDRLDARAPLGHPLSISLLPDFASLDDEEREQAVEATFLDDVAGIAAARIQLTAARAGELARTVGVSA